MKAFPAVKAVIAIMAVIAIIIVSAVVALAESDGVEDEVGLLAVNASAGMTPDSVLYGLDRAIERLELLLAKNRTRKTRVASSRWNGSWWGCAPPTRPPRKPAR